MKFKTSLFLILLTFLSFSACQQQATETAPTKATPAKKTQVEDPRPAGLTKTNWLRPPFKYWAIKNVDKLFAVGTIAKGATMLALEKGNTSLLDLKIVTGLTVAILAAEGKMDLQKPVTHYLPELKGSAWDGVSIQKVMNMEVNLKYDEAYNNPKSDAYKFAKVSHFVEVPGPPSEFKNMLEYFKSIKKGENEAELFHYVSLNTELLGMLISKVTGKKPSEAMSEKVWAKMGAAQDAFVV